MQNPHVGVVEIQRFHGGLRHRRIDFRHGDRCLGLECLDRTWMRIRAASRKEVPRTGRFGPEMAQHELVGQVDVRGDEHVGRGGMADPVDEVVEPLRAPLRTERPRRPAAAVNRCNLRVRLPRLRRRSDVAAVVSLVLAPMILMTAPGDGAVAQSAAAPSP